MSPLRRYFYRRDARRWASGNGPAAIERGYWTLGDYQADSAQLRALGYLVASESASGGSFSVDTGLRGAPAIRRRIPAYFVVYEKRTSARQ